MRSAGIVGILQPFVVVLMVLLCSTFTLSATANAQGITQLSGTVVDASGAVIAGATVQVRSANGILQKTTQTDANGSFIISGLAAGNYRLVISNPGLETKEIPVTIATTESPARLRISLAVRSVSTTINVQGREDSLIGIAESASQGTVGAAEIQDRPILRSGEILETIPGMIITQHAGGGKANQYFLRGFNLDHGTDFAIFLDGMPLNLPSHAHGEGYADMNTVTPEFVERLELRKRSLLRRCRQLWLSWIGRFWCFSRPCPQTSSRSKAACMASGGPFSAYRKSSVRAICCMAERRITITAHGRIRIIITNSTASLTYSQGGEANGFSITARAYRGTWNSSDQIPVNAVPLVGFYGALNPTDGGESQRYSLQGEWHRSSANSETKVTAYGFYYDLNLFSDFTYYLDDPVKGDQFEQQDRRWVAGLDAHHTIFSTWFGHKVANTFGLQVRNDWVHNGLYRSEDRMRTNKNDINACNAQPISECDINPDLTAVLPADTDVNKFTDTMIGFYVENKIQWTGKSPFGRGLPWRRRNI